jgi:hypothetical protein
MKKIVASVGLFAVGASGVHAASITAPTVEGAKPWSVAVTLRGFYDDNVTTAPNNANKTESFGFEASPSLGLNWASEQTSASLNYVYSFRYYDKKPPGNTDNYDQTHSFNALLNHNFSERYMVNVSDSFVIGQEPDLLRSQNTFTDFQRVPGDNIRNYGQIKFNAQLSRLFGLELGYQNSFFHYADEGAFFDQDTGDFVSASRAGLLDRIEHYVHIDGRWTVQPETTAVLGYRFGLTEYTGNEQIGVDDLTGDPIFSEVRNQRSHYAYVGVDHVFRPDLTASVRIGGRYTDYYNEAGHPTEVGPSAQASMQYTYAPESYIELGVTHDRNATDLFGVQNGSVTTDAESTAVYGTLNHRIMPRLYGSLTGQFQNSSLNGGLYNNIKEQYYLIGLNVEYRFNPHLSVHAGYNYDKLESDADTVAVNRSFDRNRVYIGVTASY